MARYHGVQYVQDLRWNALSAGLGPFLIVPLSICRSLWRPSRTTTHREGNLACNTLPYEIAALWEAHLERLATSPATMFIARPRRPPAMRVVSEADVRRNAGTPGAA